MSVHRLAKYQTDDPFTRVPNTAVESDLSLKALGLLVFMLSKPDGWNLTERGLMSQLDTGRHALATAMSELIEKGYVRRSSHMDGNLRRWVTEVYDVPCFDFPSSESPEHAEIEALSNKGFQVTKERSKSASVKKKSVRSQKTRLPESWEPKESQKQQIRDKYPKLNLTEEAEKFQDYHRAKGSSFADWDAAFRTWVRNAEKFRRQAAGMSEDGFR
jgi:hypothetical protein